MTDKVHRSWPVLGRENHWRVGFDPGSALLAILLIVEAASVMVGAETMKQVFDYFDHPLPPTRLPAPRPESCKLLTPEFFTFFDDWTRGKFLSSGLAYPIAGQTVSSSPPRSGSDQGEGRIVSVFW